MGERQLGTYKYMSNVIALNTYLESLASHLPMYMLHSNIYILCAQDSETDNCGTI